MRSFLVQVILLIIYLMMVFIVSRILDIVSWCNHGLHSTRIVDPLVLSVKQLRQLLDNRGISYKGYVEKKELAELVEASANVVSGEIEELGEADMKKVPPPGSRFSGGSHFYEEVEDTKDSVWLVQVIPPGSQADTLLDDYNWRKVCNQVAPFAIRTGIFDCNLDRRLCSSKGWNYPLLLLALPKGSRPKDRVILRTFSSTKPQSIIEWVHDELSIRVASIDSIEELERNWLNIGNSSSPTFSKDVKVLLITHLFSPPLFIAALSIKFTGRIKFGMFSVKKHESEIVRKRLKLDHRIPAYIIMTPEQKVVYGRRKFEHFNFPSMNVFLKAVQPEMNDIFTGSLIFINTLVFLQIFQVSVQSWLKHVAQCVWCLVTYNFWLFNVWLLIFALYQFSIFSSFMDSCLVFARQLNLSEIGSLLRADLYALSFLPYTFFFSFILFGKLASCVMNILWPQQIETSAESDRPWWEVLPMDSSWINYFFRPMATLTRPLPPSEIELEEGIEMLIERLAVPNLWLQPIITNEYIKDLPVWKFRGWDAVSEQKCSGTALDDDSPEAIQLIMDGKDPRYELHKGCSKNYCFCGERKPYKQEHSCEFKCMNTMKKEQLCRKTVNINSCVHLRTVKSDDSSDDSSSPPEGMRPTVECAVCLEPYSWGDILCGLPCGHSYHQICIFTWLDRDNHHCPVCRWPAYRVKHLHRE